MVDLRGWLIVALACGAFEESPYAPAQGHRRDPVPPVILLQADEGFEGNEADLGEAAVRDICVKGIAAAYLPGMTDARLPDKLNTVNTLRYVFNHYFDAGYPMLRSASYPEGDLSYQFEGMKVRGLSR